MESTAENGREVAQASTQGKPTASKRPIVVRKMGFDFSAVPRKWFFDSELPTHVANGLSLLFPAGERFFIRSVRH